MPKDNIDEKIWSKAKQAFIKQYKKEPKSSADFAVVSSIYKKLGGTFGKEMTDLVEQIQGMINISEAVYSSDANKLLKAINKFEKDNNIRDVDELIKVKKDFIKFIMDKKLNISKDDIKDLSKIGGMSKILFILNQAKALQENIEDNKMNYIERLESMTEGVRALARQDMSMRVYKKSYATLSDKEKKDINDRLDKQKVAKESFTEDMSSDIKQMSALLQVVGFDQMAKDVLKTKDKKTMLKYIGVVRRDLVKRMSALPTMKSAVPKVIELTDKIADNVNKDPSYN